MVSDLRYALRTLLRSPGFTAVALLTLALGIGANTAIFSIFQGVLIRPLPYPDAGRLVSIREVVPAWTRFGPTLPVSAWHFREWRKQSGVLETAALISGQLYTLTGEGDPVRIPAARVSASLFPMLGIQAALGRTFSEGEDQPGSDRVAVIAQSLWKNRFHADPAILGRKILVNGAPVEVIGVLPRGAKTVYDAELFVPFAIRESDLAVMAEFNYTCIARLKPGVTIPQATADLDVIQSNIVKDLREKVELRSAITPLQEALTAGSRQSLTILLAASGAVLFIVVVNLANLLLARASARRHELAVRTALGAGARRLIRQLLTESMLLAIAGGSLGLILARWILSALILKAPLDVPGLQDIAMDWPALGFGAAVTFLAGAAFGAIPAWRMSRADPQAALKSGGRTITDGRQSGRLRRILIGAEAALTVVSLVVGGLLLTSFIRLTNVDKGFRTDHAFALNLSLPAARYGGAAQRERFMTTLLQQVHTLPGVTAVGVSNRAPLSGEGSNTGLAVEGVEVPESQRPIVDYRCVSPEFFTAMSIPLLSGRMFDESDRVRSVAAISAQTARRLWPNENALGKRFRLGSLDETPVEVIGIVGDVRTALQKTPNLTVYVPYWRLSRNDFALVVRSRIASGGAAPGLRAILRKLDSQLVIPRVRSLEEIMDLTLAPRRFQLQLILFFAACGLLLAALGVYGVVAESVTQRTNEIGIRLALGASRADVTRLIGRQGLTPVLLGLAAGIPCSALAARLVAGLLFDVPSADPAAFGGAALLLLASAGLACLVPVLRATRIDPLRALRYE